MKTVTSFAAVAAIIAGIVILLAYFWRHQKAKSTMPDEIVSFGFEDFWPQASKEYADVFPVITRLIAVVNEALDAAEKKRSGLLDLSVIALVRMTGFAMNDVLILCGNGSGIGAMKIVRGMFETSILAEYLRRNPNEVSDYVDFGAVLAWRRHTLMGEKRSNLTSEQVKQLEDEYDSVQSRFTTNGKVRYNWTTKKLWKMAEELGRSESYDLVYGLACSLHHANFEGLMGYHQIKDGKLEMTGPPSFAWTGAALVAAHENLLRALETLNDCCKLGFDARVETASEEFKNLLQNKMKSVEDIRSGVIFST